MINEIYVNNRRIKAKIATDFSAGSYCLEAPLCFDTRYFGAFGCKIYFLGANVENWVHYQVEQKYSKHKNSIKSLTFQFASFFFRFSFS